MSRRALTLAALLPAIGLGACTAGRTASEAPAGRYASLDALAAPAAGSPSPGTPVARMPDWIGKPLRVRERREGGTFEQASFLTLSARGDARGNLVLVAMGRPGAASLDAAVDPGAALAPMAQPSEDGIRAEIAAAFPGIAMRVVTRPSANAYGPYGLAVGRASGGARCLYAWQWIDDPRATLGGEGWPAGPLSLRVRLCRDDITLEAMAAAVTQLRLSPPGTPGPALAEAAPAMPATPRPVRRAEAERHAARRAVPRTARIPEAPQPVLAVSASVPGAPAIVPGRRYLGAETMAPPASLAAALPSSPGPRQAAAPLAAADLPPEATRGPAAR